MQVRMNHLAVWIAAIAYFVWGYIWYGLLFGKVWQNLMGGTQMAVAPQTYVYGFVLGLILSYVTAIALSRRPEDLTAAQGVSFALFMGIGLFASQTLNGALYAHESLELWLINTLYVVIGFAIIGAIVGGWKAK